MRPLTIIILLLLVAACSRKPKANGPPAGAGAAVPVNVGEVLKKDMPLDLRAIAVSARITDDDVRLSAVAVEQDFESGDQRHKQSRFRAAAQFS